MQGAGTRGQRPVIRCYSSDGMHASQNPRVQAGIASLDNPVWVCSAARRATNRKPEGPTAPSSDLLRVSGVAYCQDCVVWTLRCTVLDSSAGSGGPRQPPCHFDLVALQGLETISLEDSSIPNVCSVLQHEHFIVNLATGDWLIVGGNLASRMYYHRTRLVKRPGPNHTSLVAISAGRWPILSARLAIRERTKKLTAWFAACLTTGQHAGENDEHVTVGVGAKYCCLEV